MIKKTTIETLYMMLVLLVWAIYGCMAMIDSEHVVDSSTGGISRYLVIASIAVVLPYLLFTIWDVFARRPQTKLFWRWTWFYLYVILFCAFSVLAPSASLFNVLLYGFPFLALLTIYIFVRRNGCSAWFLTAVFCMMLMLVMQYYRIYSIAEELGGGHIGVSYHPLFLLPLIMLHPSKVVRYASVGIVMVVLFSSMKRGGLLAFAVGMLAYILVQEHVTARRRLFGWMTALVAVAVLCVAFWYLGTHNDNYVLERFMNIQEDEGSGRLDAWKHTWGMIVASDFIDFLFGHGVLAVYKESVLGLSAHNDFLEIWYDYGLIGLVFLLIAMLAWLKSAFRLYRMKHFVAPSVFMLGAVFVVLTMVSHVIIFPWMAWVCLCLGAFIGLLDREKMQHE